MLLAHWMKGTHRVIAFGDTRPIFACLSFFSYFSCSLFGFQHSKCRQIACLQTKVQGQSMHRTIKLLDIFFVASLLSFSFLNYFFEHISFLNQLLSFFTVAASSYPKKTTAVCREKNYWSRTLFFQLIHTWHLESRIVH